MFQLRLDGAALHCTTWTSVWCFSYGWTALHYASIEGNLELIKQLVQHGVDVAVRDKDGTCAALRAKWRGHEHVVAYFCRIGEHAQTQQVECDVWCVMCK